MVAVLRSAGAGPEHLVRMTWYVTDKTAYVTRQKELGQVYRNVIGRHYPAMTLLVVAGIAGGSGVGRDRSDAPCCRPEAPDGSGLQLGGRLAAAIHSKRH